MDFIDLEYVVTLAEMHNFTRAAERLMVAQPNLSNAISKLEKRLEFPLFIRGRNSVELTPEGEQYVVSAKQILDMKGKMDQELQAVIKGESGRLHLSLSPYLARCVLDPFLPEFSASHPEVEVIVQTNPPTVLAEKLKAGKIEVGIMVGGTPTIDYLSQTLFYEPILLTASTDSEAAAMSYTDKEREYPVIPSEALNHADFILPEPNSWLRQTSEDFFAANGIIPREVVTSVSMGAVNRLAALGVGIAFLPYSFAMSHVNHEKTTGYYCGEKGPDSWKVCLYVRRDLLKKSYVKTFVECLKESI